VLTALLYYGEKKSNLLKQLDLNSYLSPRYKKDMDEVGASIKLEMTEQELDALERVLAFHILGLSDEQKEAAAALDDVRAYRKATREAQGCA
jgi:hypothetical protein